MAKPGRNGKFDKPGNGGEVGGLTAGLGDGFRAEGLQRQDQITDEAAGSGMKQGQQFLLYPLAGLEQVAMTAAAHAVQGLDQFPHGEEQPVALLADGQEIYAAAIVELFQLGQLGKSIRLNSRNSRK